MRYPRSIRAKLLLLHLATFSCLFFFFGFYTYVGFKSYLIRALQESLERRGHQIVVTIMADVPERGETYVGEEIEARFAPELSERIVRVTASDGRRIYASKNAYFLPELSGKMEMGTGAPDQETPPAPRDEISGLGRRFQVVSIRYWTKARQGYLVEVGAPEDEIVSALHGLIWTLALGFPFFIGLIGLGGYYLLGRALRPVDEIVKTAEQITFRNLNQRLPVTKTGDEVERLSLTLNRMIQRLDEAFQQTSRFSADASHELRTPLTIMRGELETLLTEEGLREDQAEQLGSVIEEIDRLTRIVEGLLFMSRLEAGESQSRRDPVDLTALAVSTAEQMTGLAADKSIALTCTAGGDVSVEGDEVRLKQVIVNLIDNAIKYTPEGGRVTLRVAAEQQLAILEVADTGIGIGANDLSHVFERFFRSAQPAAYVTEGSGLGLSMVQLIVKSHGGEVTVASVPGEGSRFRVELPRLVLRQSRRLGLRLPEERE